VTFLFKTFFVVLKKKFFLKQTFVKDDKKWRIAFKAKFCSKIGKKLNYGQINQSIL